ncbi:LacI family transcriptional regulator [Rhodanobacter sp. ANJX3]|jgi:LacI family transcriptional regulator|uniref:XylR family transcriptional regulator n=1 Tax=unclassified Rhodanobacter TaxID=2621553 RepID=UPI0015CC139A|nr:MULTISPECIES: DNA-binding transcriptional regulator [unclassified Rhodanobacter]MBB5356893.1 LacI family transcriptional regulator [Rhodanobacter sp. ANJX3]NYE30817.1 LacI family transcriptional regulator [Rhodanobacter sp. K2T2]
MGLSPPPHRIALLFNANKGYDREVIAGIGQYLNSTRVEWDLYLEEDFRSRIQGIERWHGDGIIADFDDPEVVAALSQSALPVVAVGGSYADASLYPERIPYIATDNAKLVQLGYRHLIDQGLSHFAFYSLPPAPGNAWAAEREVAYAQLLQADELPVTIFRGQPTSAGGWDHASEQLVEWLQELPKPVGILCVTDARARQLVQACQLARISVPEQIAVVGIDNDSLTQMLTRIPLTSVIQGTEEMGRTAAHLLHQMLRGADHTQTRIVVPPVGINVQSSSKHQPLRSPLVMRARHYIRQYGCLGVKTEQVADYVGVSRTALEEHFRRELKQTVHQALLQHKLEHAGELLTSSSLPLADIAVRCGFTSLQYMYAVFRREYNLTPKQFQAQQRGIDITESTDSSAS